MATVTQRIKLVKQPRGGYINTKLFKEVAINSEEELSIAENIHASLVGLAVDYLARYMNGTSREEAFKISLKGSIVIKDMDNALMLLQNINGLDDNSIISACKLVGYDVCYRASPMGYRPVSEIQPDKQTISNIRIMINRCLYFFKQYGPITQDGFTFEGAYTSTINAGDGDFLTKDTLWDIKVSKNKPKKEQTLQLLIYYIMGKHSHNKGFKDINKIGVFNPRLNSVWLFEMSQLSTDIIKEIEKEVIGY